MIQVKEWARTLVSTATAGEAEAGLFISILVPIDIAQRSSWEQALPQAIELGRTSGGKVTVMTVVRDVKVILEGGWCSGIWTKGGLDWLSRIEPTPW